ncbi:MAG: ubiquitin-like domain-containing protein, partial [Anaerolineales bacterium]
MKLQHRLALVLGFFLLACQPSTPPTVTIIDSDKTIALPTDERVPSALLTQAGLALTPHDRLLLNGLAIALDQSITNPPITLQIRRAVPITLVTPEGQQQLQSSAFTVGEVLQDSGYWLHARDKIEPALNSPTTEGMTITVIAARELIVSVDGGSVRIDSSARTVGEALAEAGIPLIGLDYSLPSANEPLPSDGKISVVRVSETVLLAQKPIPF